MPGLAWALNIDSFIVAFAMAHQVPPKHFGPLIILFGICETVGSLAALTMPPLPLAGLPFAAGILTLWGVLVASSPRLEVYRRWFLLFGYQLPLLIAFDNLAIPADPIAVGVTSVAMTSAGFALGSYCSVKLAKFAFSRCLGAALLVTAGVSVFNL